MIDSHLAQQLGDVLWARIAIGISYIGGIALVLIATAIITPLFACSLECNSRLDYPALRLSDAE